jgi:hypothetical protein
MWQRSTLRASRISNIGMRRFNDLEQRLLRSSSALARPRRRLPVFGATPLD